MLKSLAGGVAIALGCSGLAQAQQLIDATDPAAILAIAQLYGEATMDTQANGDPKIAASLPGLNYFIYFRTCTGNAACEDLQFYTAFPDIKPGYERVNEWNRLKRYGKAYLDGDLDATLEMDVNLNQGMTAVNFDETFLMWTVLASQFAEFVGFTGTGPDAG